ncbi:hypothetical protein CCACVL1_17161 [Corchorus capsularis]|uniref:Uncharacterized protein n=1 Tax=Corchorus capsularis TaxID=210143 RepID=A0A1R3HTN1_COCAP|nr:hypothetical protein CCACVL1_17161 [Corchorus capsularis]
MAPPQYYAPPPPPPKREPGFLEGFLITLDENKATALGTHTCRVASGLSRTTQLAFRPRHHPVGRTPNKNPKFTPHATQIHPKPKPKSTISINGLPATHVFQLPHPYRPCQITWPDFGSPSKSLTTLGLRAGLHLTGKILPETLSGRSHRL